VAAKLANKMRPANHGKFAAFMLHWIVPGRSDSSLARFSRNRRGTSLRAASWKYLGLSLLLIAAFFFLGKLEQHLLTGREVSSVLSLHSGLTWAVFLLWGYSMWPATFAGLLLASVSMWRGSTAALVSIAVCEILAGILGVYLVERFAGGTSALARVRHFIRLTITVAVISAVASGIITFATQGAEIVWLNWLTAWQAQLLGTLIVVPCALTWLAAPEKPRTRPGIATVLSGILLICLGVSIFGGLVSFSGNLVMGALCIVMFAAVATQIDQRELATGVFLLAISLMASIDGNRLLGSAAIADPLLVLEIFLSVFSIIVLGISALVSEHRRSEEFLRKSRDELAAAAISDPLTGLSNYRHFIDVFNAEADRSRRTGRTFALVLFDLDGLKVINDTFGHLSGTHAICRVGNTMRVYCRNIDTAVRYGGDEFALVLPETQESGAYEVARRISLQVAHDGGTPAISVSFGITTFPEGGMTFEEVFGRADAALYQMKDRNKAMQNSYRRLG